MFFRKRCDLAPFLGRFQGPDEINYGAAVWRSEENILLSGENKKQQREMFVDDCFVSVNLLC